jgi:hypothetical protein
MDRVVCHVRRVALMAVALLSVAVGVGTIWVVASPDRIGNVSTWILFGIVCLIVLPAVVVGALVLDRRALLLQRRAGGAVTAVVAQGSGPGLSDAGDGAAARGIAHQGTASRPDDAQRHRHHRAMVASQEI